MVYRFAVALVLFGVTLLHGPWAKAADLKITFSELTELVRSIASGSKIYLNNVPPGPIGGLFTSGSTVSVGGGAAQPLEIPAKTFPILRSTYAYYLNDITSKSLRIVPINGGLRLIMEFEDEGPELVARCLSGNCTFADTLPDIEWPGAGAQIDLVPVQFNGSVALRIKRVQLLGSPRAVCQGDADFFEGGACAVGRPWANRTIQQVKPEIEKAIRDEINKPAIQQQFADGLKKFLSLGPAGVIAINNLSLDPSSLTVKFNFTAAGG